MADVLGRPSTPNLGDVHGALRPIKRRRRLGSALLARDPGNADVLRELSTTAQKMSRAWFHGRRPRRGSGGGAEGDAHRGEAGRVGPLARARRSGWPGATATTATCSTSAAARSRACSGCRRPSRCSKQLSASALAATTEITGQAGRHLRLSRGGALPWSAGRGSGARPEGGARAAAKDGRPGRVVGHGRRSRHRHFSGGYDRAS